MKQYALPIEIKERISRLRQRENFNALHPVMKEEEASGESTNIGTGAVVVFVASFGSSNKKLVRPRSRFDFSPVTDFMKGNCYVLNNSDVVLGD